MDPHDPPCGSLSDTESVRSVPQQRRSRPRRRLRLTWQVEQGADTAHRDVRAASQLVEALARRVGCIPDGAPLPRAIQQQRWSPFNVPLMWSAAGTSATTPLVEWMVGASRGLTIPAVEFHEGSMEPEAAVVVGWTALGKCSVDGASWQQKISPRGSVKKDSLGVQLVTTFPQGPRSTFCVKLAKSTPEWRCWKSCTF